MKSFYLGVSILALAAAIVPASAADRAEAPVSYKDAPVYVPAPTWTGFYIGAHAGGAWGSGKLKDIDNFDGLFPGSSFSTDSSGPFGGAQFGYNWQRGNFVFGIETDLGAMGLNHTQVFPFSLDGLTQARQHDGFYGDVTGRLGYASGPVLLYAKGGFAFFDGNADAVDFETGNGIRLTSSQSTSTFTGWTLGGGLEYALSPAWSVKAEYQHFDFGNEKSVINCPIVCSSTTFNFDHTLAVETIKAGINYHLQSSYEPLK